MVIENGKARIACLRGTKPNKLLRSESVCKRCIQTNGDQKCTSVWVNTKLKEKACRDDVHIDNWIWVEGLSIVKMSGLIAWRFFKRIKIIDENGRIISELA